MKRAHAMGMMRLAATPLVFPGRQPALD